VVIGDHGVDAVEVHGLTHCGGGTAERHDQLVERAASGDLYGRAQHRCIAKWQQLFRRAQSARDAGGQHDTGHP